MQVREKKGLLRYFSSTCQLSVLSVLDQFSDFSVFGSFSLPILERLRSCQFILDEMVQLFIFFLSFIQKRHVQFGSLLRSILPAETN